MQAIYWFCALIGGGFVLLSAFGGLDGPDFDTEWELDLDWFIPGRSRILPRVLSVILQPLTWLIETLISFRFWTFGTCFFGLTGLVLSYTQSLLGLPLIRGIALGMGFMMGVMATSLLRTLHRRQVNSLTQPEELVGALGTVEIPFNQNSRGKVRIQFKDSILEFSALTNDPKPLEVGEQVVVIALEENRVWVVSDATLHHLQAESSAE